MIIDTLPERPTLADWLDIAQRMRRAQLASGLAPRPVQLPLAPRTP